MSKFEMEREKKHPKNRSFNYGVKDQPREQLNVRDSSRQIHQHLAKKRRFDQNMEKRRSVQDKMDGSERQNYPQNCQSQCGGEVGRRQEKRKIQNVNHARQVPKDDPQFGRSQQCRGNSTKNGHWHEVKSGQTQVNESPVFRSRKLKRCWEGQAEAKDGDGFHQKRKQNADMEYSPPRMTLEELDKKLAEYHLPTQSLPVKSTEFNYPQNCQSQFGRSQQIRGDSTKDGRCPEVKRGRVEAGQTKANESPVFRSRQAEDEDGFQPKRQRVADIDFSSPRITLEELVKKLSEIRVESRPVKSMDVNHPGTQGSSVEDMEVD
ncbi:Hypothetical predicted protein [Pelobates cultripes]|uniref:Uncharacterized protein n=1 Tax=Pelobates cultripes TaxID=61616 RepID=A0AAD1TGY6_PELCU|nr:Hypothetical predicted protein [Pelobates cultripes]